MTKIINSKNVLTRTSNNLKGVSLFPFINCKATEIKSNFKFALIIALLLLNVALVKLSSAQIGVIPYNDFISPLTNTLSCTSVSPDFTNKYGRMFFYAVDANMPVKTIRLNLNIFQKTDGSGNFQNNVADKNRLNGLVTKLNQIFSNVAAPSDPWAGVPLITDTKIRFEANIYFYKKDAWQNSIDASVLLSAVTTADPTRLEQLNIMFVEPSTAQPAWGYAILPTNSISDNSFIVTYGKWLSGSTVQDEICAKHLAHELGHCLDLLHPYDGTETCNQTDPDYLADLFGTGSNQICPQIPTTGCLPSASATDHQCTNNMMGGLYDDFNITPMQMQRMHRSLSLKNVRKYVKNCPFNSYQIPINSNETWDFNIRLYNNISVNLGATLTLTCSTLLSDNAKIIVKRGATLIIDGGKITSGCNMWKGIEVWGKSIKDQYPLVNNPDQGRVLITNSGIIENALNAVVAAKVLSLDPTTNLPVPDLAYTGGIVQCINNATFTNNQRGVVFYDYENHNHVNPSIIASNSSSITNCVFNTTQNLNIPTNVFDSYIILNGVRGVGIRGNEFKNTAVPDAFYCEPSKRGTGITVHDAVGYVGPLCLNSSIPCNSLKKNVFTNLYYGVKVENTNTSFAYTVDNNDFSGCERSIKINNAANSVIVNNNITNVPRDFVGATPPCPPASLVFPSFGIDIENTPMFTCENNTLNGTVVSGYKPQNGIVISNCGPNANQVYNNVISNFEIANHNQYVNDDIAGTDPSNGLKINCNSFTTNDNDIVVQGDAGSAAQIGFIQGTLTNQYTLARNLFNTNNCVGGVSAENNFKMDFTTSQIVYYGHNPEPNTTTYPTSRPNCADALIQRIQAFNLLQLNRVTDCPSTQNNTVTQLQSKVATATANINTYTSLYDGNNTKNLLDSINSGSNVSTLKSRLLGYSPFVSDEALSALIARWSWFGITNLNDVLIANSRVTNVVQQKINTLPVTQRTQVNTAIASYQNTTSGSESTYFLLQNNRTDKDINNALLLNYYQQDSNYYDSGLSSTIAYLTTDGRAAFKEQLLSTQIRKGNFGSGDSLLSQIQTLPGMANYALLQNYLMGFAQNVDGVYALANDSIKKANVAAIAADSSIYGYTIARAMMKKVFGKNYNEVLLPNIISGGGGGTDRNSLTNDNQDWCRIYPNPATSQLTLEYNFNASNVVLELYNVIGLKVISQSINSSEHELQLPLQELATGVYIVKLRTPESTILTSKLIISK